MQIIDEGRSKVRSTLTPLTAQLALQRILPHPCTRQYTVVILMPQISRIKLLKSFFRSTRTGSHSDAKVSYDYAGFATTVFLVRMPNNVTLFSESSSTFSILMMLIFSHSCHRIRQFFKLTRYGPDMHCFYIGFLYFF